MLGFLLLSSSLRSLSLRSLRSKLKWFKLGKLISGKLARTFSENVCKKA